MDLERRCANFLKGTLSDPLLGQLLVNFSKMDTAHGLDTQPCKWGPLCRLTVLTACGLSRANQIMVRFADQLAASTALNPGYHPARSIYMPHSVSPRRDSAMWNSEYFRNQRRRRRYECRCLNGIQQILEPKFASVSRKLASAEMPARHSAKFSKAEQFRQAVQQLQRCV